MCEPLVSLTTLIFHPADLQYPAHPYAMLHVATIQACSSFCLICYCANHREFIMILCTISNIVELSVSVVLFTSRIATGESKSGKEEANVISGYKATISSECFLDAVEGGGSKCPAHDENHSDSSLADPRVSEEAKEHAREYLEHHGVDQ